MKPTTKKILVAALVCTIPFGMFAYDKYESKDDRYGERKSSYCNDKNHGKYERYYELEDDFDELSYEFMEKNGVNLVFEGRIQLKPKDTLNGVWTISGKEVIVSDETIVFMENNISITDEVAVLAKRENGKIKAVLIEQD